MLRLNFSSERDTVSVAAAGGLDDGLPGESCNGAVLPADIPAWFPEAAPLLAFPRVTGSTAGRGEVERPGNAGHCNQGRYRILRSGR